MSENPNEPLDDRLPPPLMTSEPGSFARQTIVERKPQIIRRVLEDNHFPQPIVDAVAAFRAEIAGQPIRPLREDAPDVAAWNAALADYAGRTWLEVPWYFAETFFYRKLLEATTYFQPGPWEGFDPFRGQKKALERQAVAQLARSLPQVAQLPADARFEALLHACLWGNRADLSNFTVRELTHDGLSTRAERHHILIDHTEAAHELLAGGLRHGGLRHGGLRHGGLRHGGLRRLAFVNDNVGADSLFDLVLADFLLAEGWVEEIIFHLKDRPFFVSDAMPRDVRLMLARLRVARDESLAALGERLWASFEEGRLRLRTDPFWVSWLGFRDMPPALLEELASADLRVLKGDVNYRRLLDDRHWPHTTPLEAIAGYFPKPFLALRTLKGEIMAGLQPGQAEALAAEDPGWLVNGKRGICQLVIE